AIIPAMFAAAFPVLNTLNIMGLRTPQSAILSAVIFNAVIIIALIPLALKGVKYRPMSAAALLRRNLLIYGLGGIIVPFIGLEILEVVIHAIGLAERAPTCWRFSTKAVTSHRAPKRCVEIRMKNLVTAVLMAIATTIFLGLAYPLIVTGLALVIFPDKANGQLIRRSDGTVVGSRLIGQPFSSPGYFRSRPSAAGASGYDAAASSGSNLGPTNQKLIDRVKADVEQLQTENPGKSIPIDLVTTSGSGLDPHISPAAAEFQIPRVARERGMSEGEIRSLVSAHTEGRQFGFLGEPR